MADSSLTGNMLKPDIWRTDLEPTLSAAPQGGVGQPDPLQHLP